jgi:hypothetical protein
MTVRGVILVKKIILALSVCAALVFAGCSFAEVKKFKDFSADVPAGWTSEDDGEGTVTFTSKDGGAAVTITVAAHDGASAKEITEAFREELKGKEPNAFDEGFVFEYTNDNGVKGLCVVTTDEKNFLAITGTGDDPNIEAIINSVTGNK